jgi:trehalose synthase
MKPEEMSLLDQYEKVVGAGVIEQLRQLAAPLAGMKIVHVNSTKEGGGVAEILHRLIPLKRELGLDASWEVINGEGAFYQCTKSFHNGFQGNPVDVPDALLRAFEETNARNAEVLRPTLEDADLVIIHDPQPAPLLSLCPNRRGPWIWRCHIDASRPYRPIWKYIRSFVEPYDASIWSLADFAQRMSHPTYLIPPSIDPISDKNRPLTKRQIDAVAKKYGIDRDRPLITQVSRFDRFKDPVGVIQAYRFAKQFTPLQLVLAGGGASDDPEGEVVLREVEAAAGGDPDVHILMLPSDAHTTINALQRLSDIVVQKSTREGFGLTVTEGLWKGRPVIGGNTGGIRLQVVNHHTGFLVNTPEGAAFRIRYLLNDPEMLEAMGQKAQRYVLENFLITRHLRDYLALMLATLRGEDRIEMV